MNALEEIEKEELSYINGNNKDNSLIYDYGYIHGLRKAKSILKKQKEPNLIAIFLFGIFIGFLLSVWVISCVLILKDIL